MAYDIPIMIKVDRDTKKKMEKINVNWSEAIRKFIADRLNRRKNIALALLLNEKVLDMNKKGKKSDSTAIIRKMRDTRYGPGSS